MRLATFDGRAAWHVGMVDGDEIVDLTAADPPVTTGSRSKRSAPWRIRLLPRPPDARRGQSRLPAGAAA